MVLDNPLQALGAAVIVFFFLLGALYLLDPSISEKVWLGILFVLIGVTILLFFAGQPGLAAIVIGAIGALIGRVVLDRMGVGDEDDVRPVA